MFLKLHTDKHTNRQTDKHTNRQTDKQTNRQTDAIKFYGLHTVVGRINCLIKTLWVTIINHRIKNPDIDSPQHSFTKFAEKPVNYGGYPPSEFTIRIRIPVSFLGI